MRAAIRFFLNAVVAALLSIPAGCGSQAGLSKDLERMSYSDPDLTCDASLPSGMGSADPIETWEDDRDYWVLAFRAGDPSPLLEDEELPPDYDTAPRDILIVGDIVHLDRTDFPFLERTYPVRLINDLYIDARKVIVDTTIAVDSAAIRIVADEVVFTENGQVVLADTPRTATSDFTDGIDITARVVDLRRAPDIFLAIETWSNIDANGVPQRRLALHATEVILPDAEEPPADWRTYLKSRTLDILDPSFDPSSTYTVKVGADAADHRRAVLREDALWPIATAAKAARVLAVNPYDAELAKHVSPIIESLYEEIVGVERFSGAAVEIERVQSNLLEGNDINGYSPYYVPRIEFTYLLERFGGDVERAGRVLDGWLSELDGTAPTEDEGVRLRERVDRQHKELELEVRRLDGLVRATEENRNRVRDLISTADARLVQLQARCKEELDAQEERYADARNIEAVGQIVASVGAVACAVFAPPAAPFVAGGSKILAGNLAAHNRTGVGDLQDILARSGEALERGAEIAKQAQAVADSFDFEDKVDADYAEALKKAQDVREFERFKDPTTWPDIESNYRKALADAEEAKRKGYRDAHVERVKALGTYASAAAKFEGDQAPAADDVPGSCKDSMEMGQSRASLEAELQGYILAEAALRTQIGETQQEIRANRAVAAALSAAKATNARERAQRYQRALLGWNGVFAGIGADAAVLQRSFNYFGRRSDLASGNWLETLLQVYDVNHRMHSQLLTATNRAEAAEAVRRVKYRDEANQLLLVARNFELDLRRKEVVVRRGAFSRGVLPLRVTLSMADPVDSPEHIFVDALNREIRRQADNEISTAPLPILIPATKLLWGMPGRLYAASVTRVIVDDRRALRGKGLALDVVHPGYGGIVARDGRQCVFASVWEKGEVENRRVYPSITTYDPRSNRTSTEIAQFVEGGVYAPLPLQTPYYLETRLRSTGAGTADVPQVKSVELTFWVID